MLVPAAAMAEPLPAEACEALIQERALLEGGGAGENIARGVEWGKTKLTPEQLAYIKRLIIVREDVAFRCRNYDVVREPSPPAAAAAADAKAAEKAAAAAKDAAGVPPPVRRRSAETSKPAAAKTTATPASDAKPAAKRPAKPAKAEAIPRPAKNDAYVPPEGSESTLKVPAGAAPAHQQQ